MALGKNKYIMRYSGTQNNCATMMRMAILKNRNSQRNGKHVIWV